MTAALTQVVPVIVPDSPFWVPMQMLELYSSPRRPSPSGSSVWAPRHHHHHHHHTSHHSNTCHPQPRRRSSASSTTSSLSISHRLSVSSPSSAGVPVVTSPTASTEATPVVPVSAMLTSFGSGASASAATDSPSSVHYYQHHQYQQHSVSAAAHAIRSSDRGSPLSMLSDELNSSLLFEAASSASFVAHKTATAAAVSSSISGQYSEISPRLLSSLDSNGSSGSNSVSIAAPMPVRPSSTSTSSDFTLDSSFTSFTDGTNKISLQQQQQQHNVSMGSMMSAPATTVSSTGAIISHSSSSQSTFTTNVPQQRNQHSRLLQSQYAPASHAKSGAFTLVDHRVNSNSSNNNTSAALAFENQLKRKLQTSSVFDNSFEESLSASLSMSSSFDLAAFSSRRLSNDIMAPLRNTLNQTRNDKQATSAVHQSQSQAQAQAQLPTQTQHRQQQSKTASTSTSARLMSTKMARTSQMGHVRDRSAGYVDSPLTRELIAQSSQPASPSSVTGFEREDVLAPLPNDIPRTPASASRMVLSPIDTNNTNSINNNGSGYQQQRSPKSITEAAKNRPIARCRSTSRASEVTATSIIDDCAMDLDMPSSPIESGAHQQHQQHQQNAFRAPQFLMKTSLTKAMTAVSSAFTLHSPPQHGSSRQQPTSNAPQSVFGMHARATSAAEQSTGSDIGFTPFKPSRIQRAFTTASAAGNNSIMESPNSAALRECQLLPCSSINKDNIKRITSGTLSKLINGEFNDQCDRYMILDCRFAEEYNGGHIKNAIHMSAVDQIDNILFNSPPADGERAVLVLHCEFSQVRGPTIAQQIRQRDRALNVHRYPQLYYPELYVLQGGYRAFYQSFPDNCSGGYTEMRKGDPRMQEFDRRYKRSKSFADHAFGGAGNLFSSSLKSASTVADAPDVPSMFGSRRAVSENGIAGDQPPNPLLSPSSAIATVTGSSSNGGLVPSNRTVSATNHSRTNSNSNVSRRMASVSCPTRDRAGNAIPVPQPSSYDAHYDMVDDSNRNSGNTDYFMTSPPLVSRRRLPISNSNPSLNSSVSNGSPMDVLSPTSIPRPQRLARRSTSSLGE